MSSTASVGGLVSGLDTNSILDQLYQLARTPIRSLEAKKETLSRKALAWSQLEARLINFRTTATPLASPLGFQLLRATSSHLDLATASASSDAVPGSYSFTVQALAQTHQLKSQGYTDIDQTEVGSGTVTITVGSGDPIVIDVDNFTLGELRDAINDSGAGVTAAIVNDGSGTTPYRLIISSQTSGLDGEVDAVVSLAGGTAPTFSDLQAAQDAQIQLGSGAGALSITSGSNTITDGIPGITLQLLDADPATTVNLTVSQDNTAIEGRINDLVETYNAIIEFFSEQFSYDATTGQSGTLFADYRLQNLQMDLVAAVTNQVTGLTAGSRSLADLGIRSDSTGKLIVDAATLSAALAADIDDVVNVFAAVGEAADSAITYLAATTDTQPSGSAGWDVDITQVATQSRVTGGVAQNVPLAADETLTIQGVNISLTAGMTQAQVVAAINAVEDQTGVTAIATDASGQGSGAYLTLTRSAYGSAYHLSALASLSNQGGNDTSGLGNVTVTDETPGGESGVGTGAAGFDVDGTIGGESATGSGQRLTADSGDPHGLALLVTATETGSYGNVVFTVGAAEAAFRVVVDATDTYEGTIAAARDLIDDTITDIDQEIARLDGLIEQEQTRLRASFARMEEALAKFESQSQLLTRYVSQMQANSSGSSS